MQDKTPHENTASSSALADLTSKLSQWTDELPAGQRAMGQMLVEYAHGLTPERIALDRITQDLRKSVRQIVEDLNRIRGAVEGWVRIDPVWERKNKVEFGVDVEYIQRLFVRQQQ